MGSSSVKMKWGPAVCMVLIELFTTEQMLLTKVVVDAGLYVFALLTYRFMLGSVLVLPLAIILERGKQKELKLKAFIWIFTSALVGFTVPGLYYIGLGDTSPGYAINFYNIIIRNIHPCTSFQEGATEHDKPGGNHQGGWNLSLCWRHTCDQPLQRQGAASLAYQHYWLPPKQGRNCIWAPPHPWNHLAIISCLSLAVWYTVQAQMLKVFPYKYWSTVATCFVGSIQMAIIGVAMNREKATWKLKWNMSLLTIIYSAILNTAAKFVMISWVVTQRGPTYPSIFCAVSVLFTTILDSLLLGHDLSVGSILGMFLILAGLYLFLWGKRKEPVPETEEKPKELQLQTGDRTSKLPSNV